MLSDIVRPKWEETVTVTGFVKGREIHLVDYKLENHPDQPLDFGKKISALEENDYYKDVHLWSENDRITHRWLNGEGV